MNREELKENIYCEGSGLIYEENSKLIDQICDEYEKQLLKKDCEIAKLQGNISTLEDEVRRLHPNDCNCFTCIGEWVKCQ